MNDIIVITEENAKEVIGQINDAFFDIPFGNSQFQIENFVVASQVTPERAYRAIGLYMQDKLKALEEAKYNRMKEDIDIDELKHNINQPNFSSFDKRRFQLEIDKKLNDRIYTDKLINDAIKELNVLYKHFTALPKFSREQFENAEEGYFLEKLNRDLHGLTGPQESKHNMLVDKKVFDQIVANNLLENKNIDNINNT